MWRAGPVCSAVSSPPVRLSQAGSGRFCWSCAGSGRIYHQGALASESCTSSEHLQVQISTPSPAPAPAVQHGVVLTPHCRCSHSTSPRNSKIRTVRCAAAPDPAVTGRLLNISLITASLCVEELDCSGGQHESGRAGGRGGELGRAPPRRRHLRPRHPLPPPHRLLLLSPGCQEQTEKSNKHALRVNCEFKAIFFFLQDDERGDQLYTPQHSFSLGARQVGVTRLCINQY